MPGGREEYAMRKLRILVISSLLLAVTLPAAANPISVGEVLEGMVATLVDAVQTVISSVEDDVPNVTPVIDPVGEDEDPPANVTPVVDPVG